MTKPKHGGARQGAGRKAADGAQAKPVLVYMDEATKTVFLRIGSGNTSLGARIAAQIADKAMPQREES